MIRIGLIGYGHWGPNHVRTFNQFLDSEVRIIADTNSERLKAIQKQAPNMELTSDYEELLRRPDVDAVVVATPVSSHFHIVKAALLADKDVLVEKPITHTTSEAEQLISLAESRGRILMCGHIFLYNSGVRRLRQYIQDGTIGRVYYMSATRTNLGPLRHDVNSLYDLGSHDISIFHYLLDSRPLRASAWGESFLQSNIQDVCFACLHYPNKTMCHMHVSWLNPRKERTLVVVGEKKMAVWDDMSPLEPIRLYDKGLMQEPYYDSFGQFQFQLRDADVLIPKLQLEEPLKVQDRHFLDCVIHRRQPLTDGAFARDVVQTLEILHHSLDKRGPFEERRTSRGISRHSRSTVRQGSR
jgi:predicted dehydrogenase